MGCNPNNPCMGKYGKCLDVKITNACNGACAFCIEHNGYAPDGANLDDMVNATINLTEYDKVLILGGEPFTYSSLSSYVRRIAPYKKEIYLTTNGSDIHDEEILSKYITALNISIMHYDPNVNSIIMGFKHNISELCNSIEIFKAGGTSVRINCNLIRGRIDSFKKAETMILFAKMLGADSIRFAELQNYPQAYISANDIFPGLTDDPYTDGCEQTTFIYDMLVTIRMTCGLVNPTRKHPDVDDRPASITKVLYPDGNIYNGWITMPETRKTPALDSLRMTLSNTHFGVRSSSDSCHGPSISYGDRGCH